MRTANVRPYRYSESAVGEKARFTFGLLLADSTLAVDSRAQQLVVDGLAPTTRGI